MSNTLTDVKDIKVAQRALQPFMANLMPVSAFSTDFSPLPADKRDSFRAKALENGLIVAGCGPRSIRFRPPLNLTNDEVNEGLAIIDRSLKAVL